VVARPRSKYRPLAWLGAIGLGLSAALIALQVAGWPGVVGTVLLVSILLGGAVALSHRTERIYRQQSANAPPVFSAQVGAGMGQLSLDSDALRYHRGRKRLLTMEVPWADVGCVTMKRKGPLGSVAIVELKRLNGQNLLLEVADGPRLAKELDERGVVSTVNGW
jgi:hypothetical protein